MKVGDLVKLQVGSENIGLVINTIQKKCWRTDKLGKAVAWHKVEPEPHATVMYNHGTVNIPFVELVIVNKN